MSKNLSYRIVLGTFAILVTAVFTLLSHKPGWHFLFWLMLAALQGVALWEFYQIVRSKQIVPFQRTGMSLAFLPLLSGLIFCPISPMIWVWLSLLVLFLVGCYKSNEPLLQVPLTWFGVIYVGLPFLSLYQIDCMESLGENGPFWLLFVIAVTKVNDMVAFIVGSQFGKTNLSPVISPKKTYEGAIGGLIASLVVSWIFYLTSSLQLGFIESSVLGLGLGLLAGIGDLAESLLKRDAKVKDSNRVPGLGGILDMVDSLLLTAPFMQLYLSYTI